MTTRTNLNRILLTLGLGTASLGLLACEGEGNGPMEVWDLQPRAGATSGSQQVQVSGTNFRQDIGYAVYFGALRASSVTILDTNTLVVVTPEHVSGPVDVVVVAENGPAFRVTQAFTFADQGGNVMEQVGGGTQTGQERF